MDDAESEQLRAILDEMATEKDMFLQATRMLLRIVCNIVHDPSNKRFHKLKTGGKQVGKILRLRGVVEVLRILGFSEKIDFFFLPDIPSKERLRACVQIMVASRKALNVIDAWELFPADLELFDVLGSGKFGDVFEGTLQGEPVAIKTLKVETATPLAKQEFLQEANLMKNFQHNNVIRLLGVVFQQSPPYIVLELMGTCLVDMLREETLLQKEVLDRAMQVAAGMEYVHHHDILHCDLAARNVLVSPSGILKICDFGLARYDSSPECDLTDQPVKFPIRWTAPEVFTTRFLTKYSDVWAYGILFFEILTEGNTPYQHLNNKDCKAKVLQGYRLPKPKGCPDEFYDIIRMCWLPNAQERPSFNSLVQKLLVLKTIMAQHLSHQMVKQVHKRKKTWRFTKDKTPTVTAAVENPMRPVTPTGMIKNTEDGQVKKGLLRVFTQLVAADQVRVVLPVDTTTKSRRVVELALKKAGKGLQKSSKFVLVETSRVNGFYRIVSPTEHPLAFTTAPQYNTAHELYLCPKKHAANVHELIRLRKHEEEEAYESALLNLPQADDCSDDEQEFSEEEFPATNEYEEVMGAASSTVSSVDLVEAPILNADVAAEVDELYGANESGAEDSPAPTPTPTITLTGSRTASPARLVLQDDGIATSRVASPVPFNGSPLRRGLNGQGKPPANIHSSPGKKLILES